MSMSGPALRQVTSHQAIHENAWHEVETALQAAENVLLQGDGERFAEVAEVLLEVAEARVLAHAHEEEIGLYREWSERFRDSDGFIEALKGEHRQLRRAVLAIEDGMVDGRHPDALAAMHEFASVLTSHSAHEEKILTEVEAEKGGVTGDESLALGLSQQLSAPQGTRTGGWRPRI